MNKYEVNINAANETKQQMKAILDTQNSRVINKVGAFSSLYDFSNLPYKNPVLVLKTEEPGSKQFIAAQCDKIENVCYDMINHLVNDCVVMGATPVTIQDAIICGKLEKSVVVRIVRALAEAAKEQECVLTGGETSEQPGIVPEGSYILTSSIVGIVEKEDIIDGSKISRGNIVLSLQSSGIHTNGYTLVRRIMSDYPHIKNEVIGGRPFMDAVLEPHRCYYLALKDLFKTKYMTGLAHITGGGIRENLNRILPMDVSAEIDLSLYKIPAIFRILKEYGEVNDSEMLRTFNLGCGLAVVCKKEYVSILTEHFSRFSIECYPIGTIMEGNGSVVTTHHLSW
ncbi:MAG: phosphoribosylformylglycinamidine cyclo-ligase [Oscillospiraceae bacterium]|jgi:phosphoribosylformylglycinamidine cyclo-ligase|nr:phosphoribosylformylglycinamidine cyclo-ligase [Oscillospiraceae bacterium]